MLEARPRPTPQDSSPNETNVASMPPLLKYLWKSRMRNSWNGLERLRLIHCGETRASIVSFTKITTITQKIVFSWRSDKWLDQEGIPDKVCGRPPTRPGWDILDLHLAPFDHDLRQLLHDLLPRSPPMIILWSHHDLLILLRDFPPIKATLLPSEKE